MRRGAISKTALWTIIVIIIVVVVVGGAAAWWYTAIVTKPPVSAVKPAIVGQITIGFANSFSGPLGMFGPEVLTCAQFAVSQINSKGGIYLAHGPNGPGNYTINLVWEDDQTSVSTGPIAVSTLITKYHAVAILMSSDTPIAEAEMPVLHQYKVPGIPFNGAVITSDFPPTKLKPEAETIFHYQAIPLDFGEQTALVLDHMYNVTHHPVRVGVLALSEDFGYESVKTLKSSIIKHGWQDIIKIVDVEYYTTGTTDFHAMLTKLAAKNINALASYSIPSSSAAILQQIPDFPQLRGITYIDQADDDNFAVYDTAGPAANGMIAITPFPENAWTSNATINAQWKIFRGHISHLLKHNAGHIAATAYDAVWILSYAMMDAGSTDGMAITKALEREKVPPIVLTSLLKPTPQGTIFNQFHDTSFEYVWVENYWNATSKSSYQVVIWPPGLATQSPQFGLVGLKP